MAYDGRILEIPAGVEGLNRNRNELRIPATALRDAKGVTLQEGIISKEPGTTLYDAAGISTGNVTATGTIGGATPRQYSGLLNTYKVSAGGAINALGTANDAGYASSLEITCAGGSTAGYGIVVAVAGRNMANTGMSVTDAAANTYVVDSATESDTDTVIQTAAKQMLATLTTSKSWYAWSIALEDKKGQGATVTGKETAAGADLGDAGPSGTPALTPVTVTAGNTIVLSLVRYHALGQFANSSITDTAGNTYTRTITQNTGSTWQHEIWVCLNATALAGGTINSSPGAIANTMWLSGAQYYPAESVLLTKTGSGTGTAVSTPTMGGSLTADQHPLGLIGGVFVIGDSVPGNCTLNASYSVGTGAAHSSASFGGFYHKPGYRQDEVFRVRLYRAHATSALTAGQKITVHGEAGNDTPMMAAAIEIQNVSASAYDTYAEKNGTTAALSLTCGPTASIIAQVPEVAVAAWMIGIDLATGWTPGAGWTLKASADSTALGASAYGQLRVQTQIVTQDPTIIGLHDFFIDPDTRRLITVTQGGKVFKDNDAGNLDATDLNAGGGTYSTTAEHRPRLIDCGKEAEAESRKLVIFNGQDPVQILIGNGASLATIAGPSADWSGTSGSAVSAQKQPLNGVVHRERLWAWGNKNMPHTIYGSDPDDHEIFNTAAGVELKVTSSVGNRLFCGASFQGMLWLWKYPRGIFWLDDSDLYEENWQVRMKSEALGCAPSTYAVLPLDDDVLFLAADGSFHLMTAVDSVSGTKSSSLSAALQIDPWIRENVNLSRLGQAVSVWYPAKRVAMWGLPSTNATKNDLILYFDFSQILTTGKVSALYSMRDEPGALAIRLGTNNQEIPILGEGSYVHIMDQTTKLKNGVGYAFNCQTAHIDLSEFDPIFRARQKQFDWVEYIFDPLASDATLTVDVQVDRVTVATISFDGTQRRVRRRIGARGYELSFIERDGSALVNQDFRILSRLVGVKLVEDDPRA